MSHLRPCVITLLASVSLFAGGCALFEPNNGDTGPSSLTGIVWNLEAVTDLDETTLFIPDGVWPYWILFQTDGHAEARNACNACGGSYHAGTDGSLSAELACTEAACSNPPPFLDYGDALNVANRYEFREGRLYLHYTTRNGTARVLIHRAVQDGGE